MSNYPDPEKTMAFDPHPLSPTESEKLRTAVDKFHKRGFASMDPELQRKIASLGGKAVKPHQRSFSKNRQLAQEAGRRGGQSVPSESRAFSRDKELAIASGRKGGMAVPADKRSFSTNSALASRAGRKGGKS